MRIDRYVHDERLTWSAAGVLMLVAAMHLSGIARLLFAPPSQTEAEAPAPIFQISLQKLPPPRLPPDLQPRPADAPPPPTDAVQQRPRQTRPVPILVDTPSTDPVPPDVLLAPMTLARPERWWRLAALTTITSVLGGLLGYLIGYVAWSALR